MVEPASDRIAKYTAKFDTALIKSRLDSVKGAAIKNAGNALAAAAKIEFMTQAILNHYGGPKAVKQTDRVKYLNFARAIAAKIRKGLKGLSLENWVNQSLGPEYLSLGCLAAILVEICHLVFSIIYTPT